MIPEEFTYYGIMVVPCSPNSSGIRYETSVLNAIPRLRADTKDGIKALIRSYLVKH